MDIFIRLKKAKICKIFYLDNIIFEHLHFRAKKNLKDNTYLNRDRFEGDKEFHSLINLRKLQFKNIFEYLKHNRQIDKDEINKRYSIQKIDLIKLIKQSIKDNELPLVWKYKRLFYYIIRYLYSRIFS